MSDHYWRLPESEEAKVGVLSSKDRHWKCQGQFSELWYLVPPELTLRMVEIKASLIKGLIFQYPFAETVEFDVMRSRQIPGRPLIIVMRGPRMRINVSVTVDGHYFALYRAGYADEFCEDHNYVNFVDLWGDFTDLASLPIEVPGRH